MENFKIKNLGEYHDLYFQSDTLLLPDAFEKFQTKCIEIYELDPACSYLRLDQYCKHLKKGKSRIRIMN